MFIATNITPGRPHGWMDGWMDGWTDGWIDGRMNRYMYLSINGWLLELMVEATMFELIQIIHHKY